MTLQRIAWTGDAAPTEEELHVRLANEGFAVMSWSDPPRRTYAPHHHDHDESLWCIRGEITFHIARRDYRLGPGDRLVLPRGTVHAATVGAEGATYLIGELP